MGNINFKEESPNLTVAHIPSGFAFANLRKFDGIDEQF